MTEQYQDEIAVIRYHVWWPSSSDPYYQFNIEENASRNNYYGNNYTPHLFIDGNTDAGSNYPAWESQFMAQYAVPSDWEISATGTFNILNRTARVNVHIVLGGANPDGVEFVRTALVENNIYWPAPNGINWHEQTFRDMIPNVNGVTITPDENGIFDTNLEFTVDEIIVEDNCDLVMFIQSTRYRQIYQGYRLPFSELQITSVEEEQEQLPQALSLLGNYPNPFNASTVIKFVVPSSGKVNLDVYNLAGEKISSLLSEVLDAGEHSVTFDADGLPSGIYFYKLDYSGQIITQRMALVK